MVLLFLLKYLFYFSVSIFFLLLLLLWGRLGEAKMSCILHHPGVQLRLAYSWARPAILAAGKGRGGMFLAHLSYVQDELL